MKQDGKLDLVSKVHDSTAQALGRMVLSTAWFLSVLVLACRPAWGAIDPDTNAQNIKDNAVGGTVLDSVLGDVSGNLPTNKALD